MTDLSSRIGALSRRKTISGDELSALAAEMLARCGVPRPDADAAAAVLTDAQLRGSQSHGVMHLPAYARGLLSGSINPTPHFSVSSGAAGTMVIDADNGLGVLAARFAVDRLVAPARRQGIAAAAVRNSNHFGVGGSFAAHAAEHGLIGLVFSNAAPTMAPFGAKEAVLGTNPIAAGFPLRDGPPIVMDMSTSVVARARIRQAANAGEPIPADWSLDAAGRPTTDAKAAMDGTILSMSGAKGYALALMAELLSSTLSDGVPGYEVASPHETTGRPAGVSHFFILIDPNGFCGADRQLARAQAIASRIKSCAGVDGAAPPRLPGERGHDASRQARANGIPLTPALTAALAAAAAALGARAREAS